MDSSAKPRIKVLIIDDSALVRALLSKILGADPQLEVVGTAADAFIARDKIKELQPDVLTLDVEMPRMDGLQFLRNLMRLHPMPVLMVSSLTERGADVTLAALELGAIDFVTKPKVDLTRLLETYADELIEKVKIAAAAKVQALPPRAPEPSPAQQLLRFSTTDQLVAIGASTGGTEAIRLVLSQMPPDSPGVLIAQHIPRAFSAQFAARLDACSALTVQEAADGMLIQTGHAYVAPGDRHLRVSRDGTRYRCRVEDDAPVNRHRPSVDVLFQSVAENVGRNAVGVILTGMGSDGAQGLKLMRSQGAATIAQDEASSVVWGMPGASVALGAAAQVLAIEHIAAGLMVLSQPREQRRGTGSWSG